MAYFIAVYTNQVKKYCDQQFFRALGKATKEKNCIVTIVDNSQDKEYSLRLLENMEEWLGHDEFVVDKIDIDYFPKETLFLRSVTESVNYLRGTFLQSKGYEKFIIVESDVIVPENLISLFEEVKDQADIIGGIYYIGWHNHLLFDLAVTDLVPTSHVLSGCTMYDRKLIEHIPFRWDPADTGEFPDSNISKDALMAGFRLANYAKIKCLHLEDPNRNDRGRGAL